MPATLLLPETWAHPLRRHAVHAVVHMVVMAGVYNRKRYHGGFAPVPTDWVREIAGCPLGTDALSLLVKTRLLETDGTYIRGVKSKGYRFSPKALEIGFTVISAPKRISDRIQRHRKKRLRITVNAKPVYADLFRILKTVTLTGEVWALLEGPVDRQKTAFLKRVYRILAAENLRRRHWYFTHDEKTGRCFNNVANFPKDIRPFLLIGGQPTAECDIANSQPLFLAGLAYGTEQSEERTFYIELVRSGQFYETVGGWAGLGHLDRERLKQRIFAGILFACDHRKSKLWGVLEKHLPVLAAYIERTKPAAQDAQPGKSKLGSHNALALALQKKEADVMLGRIVPRLLAEGRPVLSIHDGCLCRAVDADQVRRVMEEEVEKAIGIRPMVKVKPRRPPDPMADETRRAAP